MRYRVEFFSLLTLCPQYLKAFEDTVLVSPAQTDMAGLTPLMYACTSNSEESIKYLLKKKVRLGGTGLGRVGWGGDGWGGVGLDRVRTTRAGREGGCSMCM